ncbi:MAG TPA: hypothetical protein VHE99_07205 [Gammaproteobacteria bacterium]|nr:hypothetical protein [Gammaproteobacteria bacterium]
MHYYRAAVSQQDAEAQYILGLCYISGEGVEKDTQKGLRLFRSACSGGYQKAKEKIMEFYAGQVQGYGFWKSKHSELQNFAPSSAPVSSDGSVKPYWVEEGLGF